VGYECRGSEDFNAFMANYLRKEYESAFEQFTLIEGEKPKRQ